MPLTCPRCGAQNPDDMAFCQQCSSPLAGSGATPAQPPSAAQPPDATLAPPAPPPPAAPPTPPPAVEPQPAGPAHRLPLATILGSVVGLLGLLAAGAIVFGHSGPPPVLPPAPTALPPTSIPSTPTVPPPPPTSPPAQPTNAPVVQPTSVPAQPTEAGTPTDTAVPPPVFPTNPPVQPTTVPPVPPVQPTTAPPVQPTTMPPVPSGLPLTTSMFSLQVPGGWQVASQTAYEVVLQNPSTAPNLLDIGGATVASPTTVQTALQTLIGKLQQTAPDARACGQGQPETISGAQGTIVPVCFTYTPQGGAAITVVALVWAATSTSGSSIFAVERIAAPDNQAFFTNAGQVLSTLQWTGG